MTSIQDAIKPGGLDGEPIELDDCNPLLLKQLARQERENQQPVIMRGCEVSLHSQTVTVNEGVVFAPGRWLTWSRARYIELPPSHAYLPRIHRVILDSADAGPEIRVINGTPAVSPRAPEIPCDATPLASVLASPCLLPVLYLDDGDVQAEVAKRDRERQERQDACDHAFPRTVEITVLADLWPVYRKTCRSCDYTWTEKG